MSIINQRDRASAIPLGLMMAAAEYDNTNPRVRGTVLEQVVEFDPRRYVQARRAFLDVWVLGGPRMPMLLVGLQIEGARLSWLVDPSEPRIWDAIKGWNANKSVSVALSHKEEGTHMFTIPLQTKIDESINPLRRFKGQPTSDIFVEQAIEVFSEGILDSFDIPGLPAPVYRNACLLHTAGVDRALKRRSYDAKYDAKAGIFCARKLPVVPTVAEAAAGSLH